MAYEATLIAMSQLGAVFAGFLGIVIALTRSDRRLDPGDALRTRSILHPSFLVILGSVLPLILHANGLDDARVWQFSAITGLVFAVAFSVVNIRFHLSMSAEERQAAGLMQTLLGWLLTLPGLILIASVAVGVGQGGLYIASIGSALLVASWNFITLAGRRWL